MLLYGASGHAKVICSVLESLSMPIHGIFDDNPAIASLNEYNVLGSYKATHLPNDSIIISIGDNKIRKLIANKISHEFGQCIASSAICDRNSQIGEGTVVLHNVIVQRDVVIGKHCIINTSASIDHDCVISDFVHVSPGVTLCGAVSIGEGSHVGAGATVIQNIKIGRWCVIGAGTVVINDIPDYSMVVGIPGVVKKKLSIDE